MPPWQDQSDILALVPGPQPVLERPKHWGIPGLCRGPTLPALGVACQPPLALCGLNVLSKPLVFLARRQPSPVPGAQCLGSWAFLGPASRSADPPITGLTSGVSLL